LRQFWGSPVANFQHQFITWTRKGQIDTWDLDYMTQPVGGWQFPGKMGEVDGGYWMHCLDINPELNIAVATSHVPDRIFGFRLHKLDLQSGKFTEIYTDEQAKGIDSLTIVPGPQLLIASSTADLKFKLNDFETGRPLGAYDMASKMPAMAVNPSEPHLIFGINDKDSYLGVPAQSICCFDSRAKEFQVQKWIGMAENSVTNFDLPRFPGNLFTASGKENAYMWDIKKSTPLHKVEGKGANGINRLTTAFYSNLWVHANCDVTGDTRLRLFDINGPTGVTAPDGEVVIQQHQGGTANMKIVLVPHKRAVVGAWDGDMYKVNL